MNIKACAESPLACTLEQESVHETIAKCKAGKLFFEDTSCLSVNHLDHMVICGNLGSCTRIQLSRDLSPMQDSLYAVHLASSMMISIIWRTILSLTSCWSRSACDNVKGLP